MTLHHAVFYDVPSPGGPLILDLGAGVAAPPLLLALAWLAAASLLAFLAFAFDKSAARHGAWRISERTLLTLALLGGSPGAVLGQRFLRHKTRKEPFRTQLTGIVVLHAAVLAALAVPATREPILLALGAQ